MLIRVLLQKCRSQMNISAEKTKRAFSIQIIFLRYTETGRGALGWENYAPELNGKRVQDYFSASKIPNCLGGKMVS